MKFISLILGSSKEGTSTIRPRISDKPDAKWHGAAFSRDDVAHRKHDVSLGAIVLRMQKLPARWRVKPVSGSAMVCST